MTSDETRAFLVRHAEARSRRDITTLGASYADDCVVESPSWGTLTGRPAVEHHFRGWFTTFNDMRLEVLDLIVTGDRAVESLVLEGTDTGGFLGQPATGKPFRFFLVVLYTLDGRHIVHERRVYDISGLLLQLATDHDGTTHSAETQYKVALERTRLEHEVRTAADIQQALLPEREFKGVGFELAATSLPCRAIGGDFFDYFDLPQGAFGFALGDVAGKGPPAALLAAELQGILASEASLASRPCDTMRRVNHLLGRRSVESRFVTMFYAVLSPSGGLTYSNAGHNPPVLCRDGQVLRLQKGGLILGAFRDARFEEETLQLDPGDVLLVYTDGVTEALNRDGDEFGEPRLLACLTAHRQALPRTLLDCLLLAVRDFTLGAVQNDDLTVLVVSYNGSNQAA